MRLRDVPVNSLLLGRNSRRGFFQVASTYMLVSFSRTQDCASYATKIKQTTAKISKSNKMKVKYRANHATNGQYAVFTDWL
jgi:hypothetical protein